MLDQVVNLFKIEPHYDLDLMRHGQTLAGLTAGGMEGMDKILSQEKPEMVLVQGDTTTTFVSALAAFYHQIPVGHIEAGLRTGNKYSPWPEEINRKLTGGLADLHFAPTTVSRDNLLREGVPGDRIHVTGNTVIDALLTTVRKNFTFADQELDDILRSNRDNDDFNDHASERRELGRTDAENFQALATVSAKFQIVCLYPQCIGIQREEGCCRGPRQ